MQIVYGNELNVMVCEPNKQGHHTKVTYFVLECFVIHDGKLTHNRSEHTLKFNELYNVTVKCINDTNQKPEHMCSNCLDGYLKLNDYYIDMIDENDKIAGCMDIVDVVGCYVRKVKKKLIKFFFR